jgi:uncharacterized protein (DUF2236 family)
VWWTIIEGVSLVDGTELERSITTRVLRERILALSWGSALLLHVAEPRIAQGVADHSNFLNTPPRRVARLYSTANTMLDLLVGSRIDATTAAARINAIHDRVSGITHESHAEISAGTAYSAHDPELLAWVHVALHATLLTAYARLIGAMTPEDQDRYCREVTSIEPLLGIPLGRLPRDARTLRAEFEARLETLSVGDNARRIAAGILSPRLPRWVAPATGLARLCTIGFLPEPVRAAYSLPWTRRHANILAGSLRFIRWLLPRVPDGLRCAPPELMLRWQATTVAPAIRPGPLKRQDVAQPSAPF